MNNVKKYKQIFSYLLQFSNLRNKVVRNIENSGQYQEILWFDEIMKLDCAKNILQEDFDEENDFWIEIKKPKEVSKPVFPDVPSDLKQWIIEESLLNEDGPTLKEDIVVDEKPVLLKESPTIQATFNEYINDKWMEDYILYNDQLEEYNIYLGNNKIYSKFFSIYNKAQRFGEEYELIIGAGLLSYNDTQIFRHLFVQRVNIEFEFSDKISKIIIRPDIQTTIKLESDAIIDLEDDFDANAINAAEANVYDFFLAKNIDSLLGDDNIYEGIQLFSERFSANGSFNKQLSRPKIMDKKPKVYFSPALILRKRNTRNLTAAYTQILDDLDSHDENFDIPILNELLGIFDDSDPVINDDGLISTNKDDLNDDMLYFPKQFNSEQMKIIDESLRSNHVLVQGPPGTGKSHTIANLICHLLATGKRIVITAYTKRALEVLHKQLPEEFRDLTANYLGGDTESLDDLKRSVNGINDQLSGTDSAELSKEINELRDQLKVVKKENAFCKNELLKIKEKSIREIEINSNYRGTYKEIAEKIAEVKETFAWQLDNYKDIENGEIIVKIKAFIGMYNFYKNKDIKLYEYDLPDITKLLDTEILYKRKKLSYEKSRIINTTNTENIQSQNYDELIDTLNHIKNRYNTVNGNKFKRYDELINALIEGDMVFWNRWISLLSAVIKKYKELDFREIDRTIQIDYSTDKSIKVLRNSTKSLLKYISEGNTLSGFKYNLKKKLISKTLQEDIAILSDIKINGKMCNSKDNLNILLRDLALCQDFNDQLKFWFNDTDISSYEETYNLLSDLNKKTETIIDNDKEIEKMIISVSTNSNIVLKKYDSKELEGIIYASQHHRLTQAIQKIDKHLTANIQYLSDNNLHPITRDIKKQIENYDGAAYSETIKRLQVLREEKNEYLDYLELTKNLENTIPNLVKAIVNDEFNDSSIPLFIKGVFLKHAEGKLAQLIDNEYRKDIQDKFNVSQEREKELIAKIASKLAWEKLLNRLRYDRNLKQHLVAWVQAVSKIGKTGRGKRAQKFIKIAQTEMEQCKSAIPCWIMPLYKIAETIKPTPGMYDYVIIDEASQLGPDAIFLMYIAKKIIIVGDDKQTSPEYVGVSADSMKPHIEKYLENIPFKNFYGVEYSFFDHARRFCNVPIVLREHFRCMPEIIEFSNKHFYEPIGNRLYPMKQYSENRLEPLQSVFCQEGYVEGRSNRIVNEIEAEMIALKVKQLINDTRYLGKTFGVIALQGNSQASMIEAKLLNGIGEKEFHERHIVCGNSASFQGDERDVMFLSLVTATNHNRMPLTKPADERRFNVAVSRAKEQIWLFHSVMLDDLSNTNDLRYKLLLHFTNKKENIKVLSNIIERTSSEPPHPFDSWFEVDVYNDVVRNGYSVIPQYEVANGRYRIDMAVLLNNGTKIAVECDGDAWHGPEQYMNDTMRQLVLERCGWTFFRIRGCEYYSNKIKAMEDLWEILDRINDNEKKQIKIPEHSEILKSIENDDYKKTEIPPHKNNPIEEPQERVKRKSIELNLGKYENKENHSNASKSKVNISEEAIRYLNIYKTGKYVLTTDDDYYRKHADYVLEIKEHHKGGYLLQCYKKGNVNKVAVKYLLNKKIDYLYSNGLNTSDELQSLFLIDNDCILGIHFLEQGKQKFKAHYTHNISHREQLHLKGIKVIYNSFNNIEYNLYPIEAKDKINKLIFSSFTANGKAKTNKYYNDEWLMLKILGNSESLSNQYFITKVSTENEFVRVAEKKQSVTTQNDKTFELSIGDILTHKKYGEGVLKSVDDGIMIVLFGEIEKRFQYPQAIEQGFLELELDV